MKNEAENLNGLMRIHYSLHSMLSASSTAYPFMNDGISQLCDVVNEVLTARTAELTSEHKNYLLGRCSEQKTFNYYQRHASGGKGGLGSASYLGWTSVLNLEEQVNPEEVERELWLSYNLNDYLDTFDDVGVVLKSETKTTIRVDDRFFVEIKTEGNSVSLTIQDPKFSRQLTTTLPLRNNFLKGALIATNQYTTFDVSDELVGDFRIDEAHAWIPLTLGKKIHSVVLEKLVHYSVLDELKTMDRQKVVDEFNELYKSLKMRSSEYRAGLDKPYELIGEQLFQMTVRNTRLEFSVYDNVFVVTGGRSFNTIVKIAETGGELCDPNINVYFLSKLNDEIKKVLAESEQDWDQRLEISREEA